MEDTLFQWPGNLRENTPRTSRHRKMQTENHGVWWQCATVLMDRMVKQCHRCAQEATAHRESMIAARLLSYPWLKIRSNLFVLNGTTYVLAVNYFSRCIEEVKMTSSMVIIVN